MFSLRSPSASPRRRILSVCVLCLAGLSGVGLGSSAYARVQTPTLYLNLAGPGVFLDNASAYGAARKARIAELVRIHGWPVKVECLYPLDNEIAGFGEGGADASALFEPLTYAQRVARYYDLADQHPDKDPDGLNVEHFAMTDNLMLIGALDDSGSELAASFDAAVISAVEFLLAEQTLPVR